MEAGNTRRQHGTCANTSLVVTCHVGAAAIPKKQKQMKKTLIQEKHNPSVHVHVLTSVLGVSDGGSKNLPINQTEAWAAVAANRQLRERRRAAERDFNDTGCGLRCDAVVFLLWSCCCGFVAAVCFALAVVFFAMKQHACARRVRRVIAFLINPACVSARYVTPPNVHPAKDPYPDDVPIRAREWCYWSSREWVCLSLECRRI